MTALAILRVEKLKTFGNLGGSEAHTARIQDTPNADPQKKETNIRLIGNPLDPSLEKLVRAKIEKETKHTLKTENSSRKRNKDKDNPNSKKIRLRPDAVLCSEIFLSASPEYFRPDNPSKAGEWDEQLMWNFANASTKWLLENYGDKCVRAELHLDEATPHIHAYIVPINDKTKQLSHKAMFGGNGNEGKIKLSKLQDSYASALAPIGISRGVKGSKATHTQVKKYYAAVNSDPLLMELDRLAPQPGETAQQLFERIKADPTIQTINHQLADRTRVIELEKRASQKAIASEKLRQQLENRVAELESENFYWKEQADQLRDLPLEDVAWHLGLDKADKGGNRWKGLGQVINITDSKWYDFTAEKGGGGAIDLVMHVNSCNFRQALAWLHDRFDEEGMLRATRAYAQKQAIKIVTEEPVPQFVPPTPDESKWLAVQNYLTKARGLPENFIDALHTKGWIYADEQQNAVFVMRELSGETTTGAFLRGTRLENNSFMGYALGTKRTLGWFYFHLGGKPTDEIHSCVICKSPIDALSCAAIKLAANSGMQETRMMFLAVDSPKSLPLDFLSKVRAITVACSHDDTGRSMAQAIKELLPHSNIVQPQALDWNAELLEYSRQEKVRMKEVEKKKNRGLER
ncbi:plasmid recombination protein [Scytonema hofmannii FACHB-248]|uniref:Plasmid recombination protein n=1 Tax=Scytonema hofmannii FACHB-248 TaxID=1842502 RepID=A0ABR8GWH9_9CYAN|nr:MULTISPECIES: MobV family relaxase [Nostocales]MBD2607415.1 plasmid recombination protein [Scytonema hofmannii FACHB-248]